jgi:hypothetical protein
VGDVDHRDAAGAQSLDQPEELVDLTRRKRGGGLVKQQDRWVEGHCLNDFYHLLLADAQLRYGSPRIHLKSHVSQKLASSGMKACPIDDLTASTAPMRKATEEDVLADG